MLKSIELSDSSSCMAKALDTEMTFVLLARDPAAPIAIQAWMDERVRLGKNVIGDDLMIEADHCRIWMDATREKVRRELGK